MKEDIDQEQQPVVTENASNEQHRFKKWISLAVLIVFTTTTSMVSQRSRAVTSPTSTSYCVATSVLLSELLKLVVSFLVVVYRAGNTTTTEDQQALLEEHRLAEDEQQQQHDPLNRTPLSWTGKVRAAYGTVFNSAAWMMGVPALIYVVQNLLQLVANAHLSAVAYQGISQLKLVIAALISVLIFGRTLTGRQWACMPVLMLGVLLLSQRPSRLLTAAIEPNSAYIMGVCAVLLSCICGSFAAVYIETRLKAAMSVPLAVRNAQLASFAALTASLALAVQALNSPQPLAEFNPFAGFNSLAWSTVVLRAASGYVVSMTLRYADTIMKGFATSLAILTTISLESILKTSWPTTNQLLGASLVLAATYNYVRASASRTQTK